MLNNNADNFKESIESTKKVEPQSVQEEDVQTKKSTEMPINSSNLENNNETIKEVPNLHEVMNLISQVNIDEEIGNMLDAFYVNDEPELKFFSDIKMIPKQGANMVAMDQNKSKTVEMS